jgi:hypothetical protein
MFVTVTVPAATTALLESLTAPLKVPCDPSCAHKPAAIVSVKKADKQNRCSNAPPTLTLSIRPLRLRVRLFSARV